MLNVVLELYHFKVDKSKKTELLFKNKSDITSTCSLQFVEFYFNVYFRAIFFNIYIRLEGKITYS